MRNALIIVMVLTLAAASFGDEIVKKVSFSGEKLPGQVGLINRVGQVFRADSLGADSAAIVSYYQDQGWYDCRLEYKVKPHSNGIEISYNIGKGELYKLNIMLDSTEIADTLFDDIDAIINLYTGRPAVSSRLGNLADEIIGFCANLGYPYCTVRFNNLRLEPPSILSLIMEIQPGPAVIVERVEFPGRKNLDIDFLKKYSGLASPAQYSWATLMLAQRRLARSTFLSQVDDFRLHYSQSPEIGVVDFPIAEVSPLIFDGAAGYSSNNKDLYGRFTATISNIFGKGRRVNLDWTKKDKASRRLQIGLDEPYPLGLPFNLNLALCQDDRDSLFIENSANLGLDYLSSDTYTYGVSVGGYVLNPETYGRTLLPRKNKFRLSVSFAADTRDYPLNARTGDFLRLSANFISEVTKADSLFPASTDNYRTADLRMEKYLPLFRSTALFMAFTARGDFSENIPVDRLFPLGGFGSLRGYTQDIFYVSRMAIGTFEYRLLTSRRGRAYIFTDMAVFRMPRLSGDGSGTEFKAGFGIGIAAAVKLGVATVEIAVPHDEGFSAAKLHFGILTGL